jgi:hypothetical protein
VRCPIERSGAIVTPVSGTFTLVDATNTTVIAAQAVTIAVDNVAEYIVPAMPTAQYGAGWMATWVLTMPDGVAHTFRFGAACCISGWFPVVGDQDLWALSAQLNPSLPGKVTSYTTYQTFLDTAGEMIQRELLQRKRRPWLILDGSELFEVHRLLALALIYEELSTRNAEPHGKTAARFRAQYNDAWAHVTLTYDPGQTGQITGDALGGQNGGVGTSVKPAGVNGWWTNSKR